MLFAEYDYDLDIAVQREEARQQGIAQGIAQGMLKTLFSLVREKLLTLEVASEKANMTPEAFKQLLNQSN